MHFREELNLKEIIRENGEKSKDREIKLSRKLGNFFAKFQDLRATEDFAKMLTNIMRGAKWV